MSAVEDASDATVLRLLFRVTRPAKIQADRLTLARAIETRVVASASVITPTQLGFDHPAEMAALFADDIARMFVRAATYQDFTAAHRVSGYRSRIRGKLWHLFVRNFQPLQRDFLDHAIGQVEELNTPLLAPSLLALGDGGVVPMLINGRGEPVTQRVNFGLPRKAHRLRIVKTDGRSVEFVDDMFVSFSRDRPHRLWSFLNEVEVKTPTAARAFGKQIGMSQFRVGMPDVQEIQMAVEGFRQVVRVRPEHLIFSSRSTVRNAVTLLGRSEWARVTPEQQVRITKLLKAGDQIELYKHSGFRYQHTARGYSESFCRVTLPIPIMYFDPLIDAIWPNSSAAAGTNT